MGTRSIASLVWSWFLVASALIELLTARMSALEVFGVVIGLLLIIAVIVWGYAYVVRVIRSKSRTIHLGGNL